MDLSIYRNKIEDLNRSRIYMKRKIKKYALIHGIIAFLIDILIVIIVLFVVKPFYKELFMLMIMPTLSLPIGVAIYNEYQKGKWMRNCYFPFILTVFNSESGSLFINKFTEEEAKDLLIKNKLINKFDNVNNQIAFSFETSIGPVTYLNVCVSRSVGDSSVEILKGDVFIIPHECHTAFQLRNDHYQTSGMVKSNMFKHKQYKIYAYYPKEVEPFEIDEKHYSLFNSIRVLYSKFSFSNKLKEVILNYDRNFLTVYGKIDLNLQYPKVIDEKTISSSCEKIASIKERFDELDKMINEKKDYC